MLLVCSFCCESLACVTYLSGLFFMQLILNNCSFFVVRVTICEVLWLVEETKKQCRIEQEGRRQLGTQSSSKVVENQRVKAQWETELKPSTLQQSSSRSFVGQYGRRQPAPRRAVFAQLCCTTRCLISKWLFLHQLTHNMTTDCSLNYKFNTCSPHVWQKEKLLTKNYIYNL